MPTSLNSGSMPKVRASSGMIGTIRLPSVGVADQVAQDPGEDHGRRHRGLAPGRELGVDRRVGLRQRRGPHDAARQRPAERLAALAEVAHLLRVGPGVEVRRVLELVVRDRQLEAVAEDLELGLGQLLRLVGDVAGLDAGARASSP